MELHVAKRLVVDNAIFQSDNAEVGVLTEDDDSSTAAACRAASTHPIIKQSDVNHASGELRNNYTVLKKVTRS
jgi:hypothetical protein